MAVWITVHLFSLKNKTVTDTGCKNLSFSTELMQKEYEEKKKLGFQLRCSAIGLRVTRDYLSAQLKNNESNSNMIGWYAFSRS